MAAKRLANSRHTILVDASFNKRHNLTGIGVVIHDTRVQGRVGRIIEQHAEPHGEIEHRHGEAFAVLRGLEIAAERMFRRVRIKTDFHILKRRLKRDHKAGTCSHSLPYYREILQLAKDFEELQFGYTPRRKNPNAHRLSRQAAGHIRKGGSRTSL